MKNNFKRGPVFWFFGKNVSRNVQFKRYISVTNSIRCNPHYSWRQIRFIELNAIFREQPKPRSVRAGTGQLRAAPRQHGKVSKFEIQVEIQTLRREKNWIPWRADRKPVRVDPWPKPATAKTIYGYAVK